MSNVVGWRVFRGLGSTLWAIYEPVERNVSPIVCVTSFVELVPTVRHVPSSVVEENAILS